jgi:hypothetical protein
MRYFKVYFEFKTRPLFRKGRWRTETRTFGAVDRLDAYRLAVADGELRYSRRRCLILGCEELTTPVAPVDVSPCHPGQAEAYAELTKPTPEATD